MNFPKQSQNFLMSDGQKSLPKNILSANSIYQSAISMKGMERQWPDLMSNAKYGDILHPHVSKQYHEYVHLPNYILSHTNRWMHQMLYSTKLI